jgi:hypothetical protein
MIVPWKRHVLIAGLEESLHGFTFRAPRPPDSPTAIECAHRYVHIGFQPFDDYRFRDLHPLFPPLFTLDVNVDKPRTARHGRLCAGLVGRYSSGLRCRPCDRLRHFGVRASNRCHDHGLCFRCRKRLSFDDGISSLFLRETGTGIPRKRRCQHFHDTQTPNAYLAVGSPAVSIRRILSRYLRSGAFRPTLTDGLALSSAAINVIQNITTCQHISS